MDAVMSIPQSPARQDDEPAGKLPERRRWWIRTITIASAALVGSQVAGAIWMLVSSDKVGNRALYLWFIGLPFSLFGVVWLTFRLGQAYGEKYLQYEARHPGLTAWLRVGLPLAGGLALAGVIKFLTHD
jgi:hypothetical protein